jgi:hypothetical protein
MVIYKVLTLLEVFKPKDQSLGIISFPFTLKELSKDNKLKKIYEWEELIEDLFYQSEYR